MAVYKNNALNDLHQLNLSYLMLIRETACRQDFEMATRLGISPENLNTIAQLSLTHLMKIALSDQLLFNLRVHIATLHDAMMHHDTESFHSRIAASHL